jgi:hypothetical protein
MKIDRHWVVDLGKVRIMITSRTSSVPGVPRGEEKPKTKEQPSHRWLRQTFRVWMSDGLGYALGDGCTE